MPVLCDKGIQIIAKAMLSRTNLSIGHFTVLILYSLFFTFLGFFFNINGKSIQTKSKPLQCFSHLFEDTEFYIQYSEVIFRISWRINICVSHNYILEAL